MFLSLTTLVMAQPVNDNCATATNLGTLPTPQSCTTGPIPTRGVGAPITTNTTNLGATPATPYVSMTGCQQGNNATASPSGDVWYQVTLTGTDLIVGITGSINQPNVALWQGGCGALVGLGCATGNAGTLNTTFNGLIPGTYLIQVSGGNVNDRGNFSLTLQNNLNCAACFLNHTLTVSPLPTNGFYQAGTAVTFCFRVTGWTQQSSNWLHGVELTFGSGWNAASVVPTPPSSSCDGTVGMWNWYNSCTSTATGAVWGHGFYFDRNLDGNPGNNFGDNCNTNSPGIADWVFCWTITTRTDCGSPSFSPDLSISINTLADGEAGSWGSIACQNDADVFFGAQVTCCPPPLLVNTNVPCWGNCTATATATGQGTGPWNYTWYNLTTNTTIRNVTNVAGPDNMTGLCGGVYIVTTFDNFEGCTAQDTFTVVEPPRIRAIPAIVNVTCNGANNGSITLGGTSGGVGPYQYSLNGGPFQPSNVFSGLAPGTYTVTIRDANNCTITIPGLVVTQPAPLAATPAVVNVLCNGGNTGSITINNTTGGTAPYQYSLNAGPFQPSNVFTGLTAGTYTVTVRDANNCTLVLTNIVVTQPQPIIGTPAVVNVSCNGGSNGSITINGTAGGVGPYQYSLNGGPFQPSNVFTGLAAGTYTVTIRDANNCTVTLTNIVVNQPIAITGTPVVVQPSCNGGSNGTITITNTAGGVGPYQYSLNGGPFQVSNVFSGLAAGTYTVTIRDANNCTVTLTNIVVNQPTAITGTPVVVNAVCNGGSTGSITITNAAGGTGPYQYSLNGGPFQVGNVFSGLAAGTYTVTIRDANNCTTLLTNIVVGQPQPITGTPAVVNATCNGGNTGSIAINNTAGGTGPYTYSLNGGPFQGSNVFSGLTAGTYSVTIRDVNNCTATIANIVVGQPAPVTGTPATVPVTCGNANGSITINNTTGGTGPYQYSLNGGPFQGSNVFTGLASGTYTVVIQDANGCQGTLSNILVGSPAAITGTPAIVNVTCNGGNNGSITMNAVSGGQPPYQYSLNGGPFQGSNAFTGLTAGTYSVTIRDANLCTVTYNNLVITQPAAITGTPAVVNVLCNGGNNGSITINGTTGGVGPYQYSLGGGPFQVSSTFSGLGAGTYVVTIRDASNCTVSLTNIVITQPAPLAATPAVVNVLCNGGNTGSITVNGTTGGQSPYQYSLNGGPFQGSNVFSGLTAGTYSVTVRDANNCILTLNGIVVNQPNALSASPAIVHVACNGGSTGSITVNGTTGGVGPYQYSLNAGPNQGSNIFNGLSAGTYTVVVTDANNCTATYGNLVIQEPPALAATPVLVNITCNGGNDGSITVNPVSGGVGPYQFSLNGGPFQGGNAFTGLTAGTYTVTVRDANQCTITLSNLTLTQPAAITGTPAVVNVNCNGNSTGAITINGTTGGTGGYQYSLNGGPYQGSNVFSGLVAGTYTVTVRDGNNCILTLNNLVVTEPLALNGQPQSTNVTCFGAGNGSITLAGASGGVTPYQYSLNGGPQQGSNVVSNLGPGTYALTMSDSNGCTLAFNALQITEPSLLTATDSVVTATCVPGNDGQIWVLNTSGGTPTYQYSLDGGVLQGGSSFIGVSGGSHFVVVADQNGCTDTLNVIVPLPGGLSAMDSLVHVSCNGANDAEIWIQTVGGTPSYQFSLNGGPLQSGNSFTGLGAGTYTAAVQDQLGCSYALNIVISEPLPLSATDSTVGASCNPGSDGEIIILNATGGTPAYQYSLNGGPLQTSNIFSGLNGGNFVVTLQDQNGCTLVVNSTVPSPGNISAVDSIVHPLCFGDLNGAIAIAAQSSALPIQYSFNGGPFQGTSTFTGLGAGTYTVDVRDALGCTITLTMILVEPAAITAADSTLPVSCNGGNDGEIQLVGVSGGTTGYQFSLNGGPLQSSSVFSGLISGFYAILVQDNNGCTFPLGTTVTEPAAMTLQGTSTPASCGQSDGSATVVASGGVAPYTYLWSDGQTTATGTNYPVGSYAVTVTDANGCSASDTITVANVGTPTVAISGVSNVSCFGYQDGMAIAQVSGGTGPFSFSWNSPLPVNSDTLANAGPGLWVVTVTDSLGCIASDTVTISEPAALVLTPAQTNPTCPGSADGQAVVLVTGGTPGYVYVWNTGSSTDSANGLTAGAYIVTVQDNNGCSDTASYVLVDPVPVVAAFSSTPSMPTQLQLPNATASFSNQSQNAVTYLWDFGDGDTSTDTDPSHTYFLIGDFCVTLVAYDSAGCSDTAEACTFDVFQVELEIPNTFTPNGDGINDVFQIKGIEMFPNNHLTVFNRWGNLVYEKDQYHNTWGGENYKTGLPLPDGAYYFIFTTGVENKEDIMGDVVIFR